MSLASRGQSITCFHRQVSLTWISPLTSSISGEGITGSSGPSGSLSSLSLSGSGFNTKPGEQQTKPGLLGLWTAALWVWQFNRVKHGQLLPYPRDTATALHPLCRPDWCSSRCSPFPLLQPLPGWKLEDRRKVEFTTRYNHLSWVFLNVSILCQYTPFCLVLSLLCPTSASSLRNSSSSSSSSSSGWCMDTTVPSGREVFGPITTLKTVHRQIKRGDISSYIPAPPSSKHTQRKASAFKKAQYDRMLLKHWYW